MCYDGPAFRDDLLAISTTRRRIEGAPELVLQDTKLEAETRKEIDARLEEAGWAVQDKQRINLMDKLGMAVREMDTDTGPADYMLFVDGAACRIIEAKREGAALGHVELQSKRYATSKTQHIHSWATEGEPLPFLYEASYIEIRFRDERDPTSRSRKLDIFWLKDDSLEDTENLPAPEVLAPEIVEQLEAALEEFRSVEEVLAVNNA